MYLLFTATIALTFSQTPPPAQEQIEEAQKILVGEWRGSVEVDSDELRKNAVLADLTDAQFIAIRIMLGTAAAAKKQTFDFAEDGTGRNDLQTLNKMQSKNGHWKIIKFEPDKKLVTVEIDYDDGEPKTSTLVFKRIDDKTMELIIGAGAIEAGGVRNLSRGIRHVFRKKSDDEARN